MRLVTVEFTQDTFITNDEGVEIPRRSKGDRVRVDAVSASSLVEVKKVAKVIGAPEPKATAKATASAPKPPTDAPTA